MGSLFLSRAANRVLLPVGAALLAATSAFGHTTLDQPNGGEVLPAGSTYTIEWHVVVQHNTLDWDLWYSTTGAGGPWIPIALDLPVGDPTAGSVHTFAWTVPNDPSGQVRVRVRQDNSSADYEDVSDADFMIQVATIPTLPQWGMIVMTLLLVGAGAVVLSRRRGAPIPV